MIINFNEMDSKTISDMLGGSGKVAVKTFNDSFGLVEQCVIPSGSSIGVHAHTSSDTFSYVISGSGIALCEGDEELLERGSCHICRKGLEHSIINNGTEDLVLLTIIVQR